MTAVTRIAAASLDVNSGKRAVAIAGLLAGEDLDAVSACFIDSDGLVYMAVASEGFHGINPVARNEGEPVTLFGIGARFSYAASLTPGAPLFVSDETAGVLETTAGSSRNAVAVCVTDEDIVIVGGLSAAGTSS